MSQNETGRRHDHVRDWISDLPGLAGRPGSGGGSSDPCEACPGKALVAFVDTSARTPEPRATRPSASFVTHLIAMAEQTHQARPLRRAAPADARAVYDRAIARPVSHQGKALSQIA